jgi:hypothetical protein
MPQNFTSIDEKRGNKSFVVVTMAMVAVFSMPTEAHAWIFGLSDAVLKSLQHPALWNVVAMWNTDVVLSLLAGLGFAGAVYRYNRGGAYEQLVFLGFGSLFAFGMGLTLESYVVHAASASVIQVALSTAVSYAGNVLLPMFALTQFGAMAIHRRNTWTRKLMAGSGALIVSGIVHYAQTTIIQKHGL